MCGSVMTVPPGGPAAVVERIAIEELGEVGQQRKPLVGSSVAKTGWGRRTYQRFVALWLHGAPFLASFASRGHARHEAGVDACALALDYNSTA